jgi:hypothetical protein
MSTLRGDFWPRIASRLLDGKTWLRTGTAIERGVIGIAVIGGSN